MHRQGDRRHRASFPGRTRENQKRPVPPTAAGPTGPAASRDRLRFQTGICCPCLNSPATKAQRGGSLETVASGPSARRSEEHKSELQSLMRLSYAVFCLKKKRKQSTEYPHI